MKKAPHTPNHRRSGRRLDAYKAVLDEYQIDPEDNTTSAGQDAAEYVNGDKVVGKFCVVTRSGEWTYANADSETLEEAKSRAVMDIDDPIFAESPVAIIDMDTHERFTPDWANVPWTRSEP